MLILIKIIRDIANHNSINVNVYALLLSLFWIQVTNESF